jgi:hypothetical protein
MYYRFLVDKMTNGRLFYWLGISTVFIFCVIIGFSRLILGVHSLDQVIFGLIMGFGIYYFFLDVIDIDLRNPLPYLRIMFNKYYFNKVMLIISTLFFIFILNIIFLEGKESLLTIWTDGIYISIVVSILI